MNDDIRVLALMGSRVLYGQERANIHVLDILKRAGCRILAVVEDHPEFAAIPRELRRRQIDFVSAPFVGRRVEGYLLHFLFKNPVSFISANWRISRLTGKFSPSHFHISNPFFFLTIGLFLALSRTPVIYRIGDKPAVHNVFWRWLWRRIVKRVDHFVAISRFISNELVAIGVPQERITIIYNSPPARDMSPEPERLPDHPQTLLFIGQLTPDKGIDRLIEAFDRVVSDFPESRLVVIGRISEWRGDNWARALRDRTLENSAISKRVTFVGETEKIYEYLTSAVALVVPSVVEEALSNVVGEAKAAARPSVVFPRGGLPELIEHGVDGYICRDTSIEALSDGLRYYLDDPNKALVHGRSALASMSRLGIDQFADRWLEVYRRTMLVNENPIRLREAAR